MRGLIVLITTALTGGLILGPVLAQAPKASPPSKKATAKKEDPFFTGAPFTLDVLVDACGAIPPPRLKEAVSRRGISFAPTPADYDRLKQAGAAPDLIQLIASKAPATPKTNPTKTVPTVVPTGSIALRCSPDCEVNVNGKSRGRSTRGTLELTGIPAGDAVIDIKKDGFEGQQLTVRLREGAHESRTVTLVPTLAMQQQFGKQLLTMMIEKMGGNAAVAEESNLTADGNASIWPAGGEQTDWKISAKLKLPAMAFLEISGAKIKWSTSMNGGDVRSNGDKKLKGSPVALEMEKLIRLYREYQPAALITRMQSDKMKPVATSAEFDSTGHAAFKAVAEAETYRITLNQQGLPIRVSYESASGLGSGLEVVYSDYAAIGKAQYPKSMAIKYAGQAQHGIELHFNEVNLNAKVADKEFKR